MYRAIALAALRRDIDPDALKVLYRLRDANYIAYLVGGSVRDLLLGRRPKDFDVGTSAHPYQVKRLFRNCWIIGRRFRLAHVRFGQKVIEVATFRRHVPPTDGSSDVAEDLPREAQGDVQPDTQPDVARDFQPVETERDLLIRRDNTFGTPEEDAFRRDFTVNALFYDIATFSIIDYVGGLRDLQDGIIRCIGDPDERFQEDPVRMFRAVAFAGRLRFALDPPVEQSIRRQRREIARSAPPRLLDEYYKVLRTGASERVFRALADVGLLEPMTPELQRAAGADVLWQSLAEVDAFRARFDAPPEALTNPILLGSLLVPLGFAADRSHAGRDLPEDMVRLGILPLARRDVERLYQILALQRRLRDPNISPRAARSLVARGAFADALTWLEVHGRCPADVERWRTMLADMSAAGTMPVAPPSVPRRRRRRRPRRPITP
jgi:poly(A) polymerase